MVKRNENLEKLAGNYLFPEINLRKQAFSKKHPEAKLISLGVGDTTEPITSTINAGLVDFAKGLGTKEGYSGYGFEQGSIKLREQIAEKIYHSTFSADEIFISDGAKCDIGRLQLLFGDKCTIAVQDPSYPAYVDTSVIVGQTGDFDKVSNQYQGITYLKCTPENNFFPKLETKTDLIYFCSPNNPTGAVATKEQLQELVSFAKKQKSIIIFDTAYALYIKDAALPKSIYEIPGAKEVAIEINSFSKIAGFTGVRLGWCVIPEELKYDDGKSVKEDWDRLISTFFNGASNIAMSGGIAALSDEGLNEMRQTMDGYLDNAKLIETTLKSLKFETFGCLTPFVWTKFPGRDSWDVFNEIMEKAHIIVTPGSGFGQSGNGFIRFSAFGHKEDIEEACRRLKKVFSK